MKKPVFKVGDKVTYKSRNELPNGEYVYSGNDQGGYVGTVLAVFGYNEDLGCYKINVSVPDGTYDMLESEFVEYNKLKDLDISINAVSEKPKLSFNF